MKPIKLSASLPQHAFLAKQLLQNEAKVAQKLGFNTTELMESAGQSVFEHIEQCYPDTKSLVVVCGKGNNGGDGFVVARLAKQAGFSVTVILCAEPIQLKGEAAFAFKAMLSAEVSLYHINSSDNHTVGMSDILHQCLQHQRKGLAQAQLLIVDCLFGIGFSGQLTESLTNVVDIINSNDAKVVSVDVPSGLSADSGNVEGKAVRASSTVTMIAIKRGLVTGKAASYVGELYLAELGVGQQFAKDVVTELFVQGKINLPILPKRAASSHKGDIGSILAIGGNHGMPGAIRLAAEAGLRSGAALMAVCCHQQCQALVFSGRPEIMLAPHNANTLDESHILQRATALLIGPGLGQDEWATALFHLVMKQLFTVKELTDNQKKQGVVVDADGLRLLSQTPHFYADWILTPHVGEAAQLLGCSVEDIEQDRYMAVNRIVEKYGGICVLKGAGTLISNGKETWINTSGNAGMASGGMGDVLSGIIAALWLQCSDPLTAVRLAVYFHGKAADHVAENQGQRGMLASDLFPYIQQLVNE